ncbi:retinoid-inducible serine carboxypeptidase-like isoform X2 [Nylanderia fulva]|uniref:retinoid-inducible serine carboxypeptidase-like isoform X2 n=1 Tax=Nylanderia fulva TaxID=613905 RepID=UPI0010FAEA79|nr:retinoid-inducible serine carboxypeptidase-like isoform X2 [Nylanderia fulva]
MKRFVCIFAILCFVPDSIGRKGFGPGEQEWGYVEVRPFAKMFWWLYFTTADVKSYYDKPLIIWLQGGPGASSTAYGNFEELGPLDVDLNPRNYTWVKNYNVLFIDNPVGSGFSYVTGTDGFVKTNAQIASDLVECMRGFYDKLPKFKPVPTYITTESYGGKMGAEFALVWYRAQKAGNIESNLLGVALGDAWISPIDSVMTWAPYLLSTGMVDTQGFELIDDAAKMTKDKVETDKWRLATTYWAHTQNIVLQTTYNVDFYNILERKQYLRHHFSPQTVLSLDGEGIYRHFVQRKTQSLDDLMNGPVRKALNLTTYHGNQSDKVFDKLSEDFMKPVTNIVELLLNETNLNVFVYNGQLDLIVDTPGTLLWVEKLKWKDADTWNYISIRQPLVIKDNIVEGYVKTTQNFAMYWINRAGHMVPRDNPVAMETILQDLTSLNKN